MYDGVLEHKEGVLFYSPSCNRKKFGFKNKKELQNEAHTCKTNLHKATASKKLLVQQKIFCPGSRTGAGGAPGDSGKIGLF